MKKYLLATASALAIVGSANAADLAVKAPAYRPAPVPLWAGWYVGIQGGVVSNRGDFTDLTFTGTSSSTKIGGAGGVNFGWLGQRGSLVYGVEADWMWVGAKAKSTFANPGQGSTVSVLTFDPNWVGTIRGKAGLALDATLVYITGGVAFGHVKNSLVRTDTGFNQTYEENTTRVGWTMGFGVAHQATSNVVVKAEGRYVDLGKRGVDCTSTVNPTQCSGAIGATPYKGEFSNSLFMGLVGVDFKF